MENAHQTNSLPNVRYPYFTDFPDCQILRLLRTRPLVGGLMARCICGLLHLQLPLGAVAVVGAGGLINHYTKAVYN